VSLIINDNGSSLGKSSECLLHTSQLPIRDNS
jgi:hypothetical protein